MSSYKHHNLNQTIKRKSERDQRAIFCTCCSLNALRRAFVSETERGNDSRGPVYDSGTEIKL